MRSRLRSDRCCAQALVAVFLLLASRTVSAGVPARLVSDAATSADPEAQSAGTASLSLGAILGESTGVISRQLTSALCETRPCVPRSEVVTRGRVDLAKMSTRAISGFVFGSVSTRHGKSTLWIALLKRSKTPSRTWSFPLNAQKKLPAASLRQLASDLSEELSGEPAAPVATLRGQVAGAGATAAAPVASAPAPPLPAPPTRGAQIVVPPPEAAPPPAATAEGAHIVAPPPEAAPPPSVGERTSPPPSGPRTEGMLVAVPATRTVGNIPARVQAAFEQSLVTEVRKLDGVGAIGASEIGDVVSSQAEGRMRGCTEDEACLLEVASGIGMSEMLSSEIVVDGKTYVVTMRRVSVRTGKPIVSDTRKVANGNGGELLEVVGPLVEALYPGKGLKAGATRGVAQEDLQRLNPPPLPVWLFTTTATAAAVSLVAGGTFAILSQNSVNDYNALVNQSKTQIVSGAALTAVQNRLDSDSELAKVFLITGGVLAVGAGTEAFFTDWKDYRSQVYVVPTQKGGGAEVGMVTRF